MLKGKVLNKTAFARCQAQERSLNYLHFCRSLVTNMGISTIPLQVPGLVAAYLPSLPPFPHGLLLYVSVFLLLYKNVCHCISGPPQIQENLKIFYVIICPKTFFQIRSHSQAPGWYIFWWVTIQFTISSHLSPLSVSFSLTLTLAFSFINDIFLKPVVINAKFYL